LTGEPLVQLLGYHPLSFFAPKAAYAVDPGLERRCAKFRELVKALHQAASK